VSEIEAKRNSGKRKHTPLQSLLLLFPALFAPSRARSLALLLGWVVVWLIGCSLGGGLLRCVGREYRLRMKAPRHSVVGRVWHGEGEELSAGVSCASFGCGNRDTQQQQQRIATGAVDGSVRVWLVNATGSTSETNLLVGAGGTRT